MKGCPAPEYSLIAANLPYSYTKLTNRLKTFQDNISHNMKQTETNAKCSVISICQTLCGNDVPQIKLSPITIKK